MWVLIVITTFILNNGNTGGKMVAFQEFSTRDTCMTAGYQLASANIKTTCVEK